jgi:hypothetical protein
MTRIFLVNAHDTEGEDMSWFIEATSPEQAIELYRAQVPEVMGLTIEDLTITRARMLPNPTGAPRAIPWEEVAVVFENLEDDDPDHEAAERELAEAEAALDDLETAYLNGEISKRQWQNGGA